MLCSLFEFLKPPVSIFRYSRIRESLGSSISELDNCRFSLCQPPKKLRTGNHPVVIKAVIFFSKRKPWLIDIPKPVLLFFWEPQLWPVQINVRVCSWFLITAHEWSKKLYRGKGALIGSYGYHCQWHPAGSFGRKRTGRRFAGWRCCCAGRAVCEGVTVWFLRFQKFARSDHKFTDINLQSFFFLSLSQRVFPIAPHLPRIQPKFPRN